MLFENDHNSTLVTETKAKNINVLIFKINDLEELIVAYFLNKEENENIDFFAIIELNDKLIEEALTNKTNQNNVYDKNFHII
ncbi:9024_t:CDS:1, partial [Cetraspora pellucida]